jgi:hypothetical protein
MRQLTTLDSELKRRRFDVLPAAFPGSGALEREGRFPPLPHRKAKVSHHFWLGCCGAATASWLARRFFPRQFVSAVTATALVNPTLRLFAASYSFDIGHWTACPVLFTGLGVRRLFPSFHFRRGDRPSGEKESDE